MSRIERTLTSRRGLLQAGWGLAASATTVAVLTACGNNSDISAQYNSGDNKGYVAGDGSFVVFKVADRGQPVELQAKTYTNVAVDFADWRGHVVVMNMWYATCPPCRREAPELAKLANEMTPKGVKFIGLNTRDEVGEASAFESKFKIPYSSMPDPQKLLTNTLGAQHRNGLVATPTTWVLDKEGRLAAIFSGSITGSTLKGVIEDVAAGKSI